MRAWVPPGGGLKRLQWYAADGGGARRAERERYWAATADRPPRRTYFWILPVAVLGSSGRIVMPFGTLKPPVNRTSNPNTPPRTARRQVRRGWTTRTRCVVPAIPVVKSDP